MKKLIFSIFLLILSITIFAQDENFSNDNVAKYIARFKDIAIQEQIRVGIPAAITLAQGIHESAASTSELATKAHNHFGIKCKKDWTGETFLHDDDALQECFRKYNSDEESYLDHSNYLKNNRRYAFLFDMQIDNYKEWAIGLRKAGYATNPKYSTRLIELIEKYKLQKYTLEATAIQQKNLKNEETKQEVYNKMAIEETQAARTKKKLEEKKEEVKVKVAETAEKVETEVYGFVKKVKEAVVVNANEEMLNGLRGFYARKGDMLLKEAVERNIKYARLLDINDLDESPLPADMFIYVEKKFKKSPIKKSHIVQEGETMIMIAQAEGMQLKSLLNLNLMEDKEVPAAGARIYLQNQAERRPILVKKEKPVEEKLTNSIAAAEMAAAKKTEDVNIANTIFTEQEKMQQKENTKEDGVQLIPKTDVVAVTTSTINPADIAEAQNNLAEEIANSKSTIQNRDPKTAETVIANVEAKVAEATNTPKPADAVKIKEHADAAKKELAEASRLAKQEEDKQAAWIAEENAREEIIAKKKELEDKIAEDAAAVREAELAVIQAAAKPAPKSPSTYTEPDISDEMHRMKKIMDKIVYAPPPLPKPKKVIPVSTNTVVPPKTTPKSTTEQIAGNSKNTLPVNTDKKTTFPKPAINSKTSGAKKTEKSTSTDAKKVADKKAADKKAEAAKAKKK
jgi:hypothetical protein